MDKLVAMTRLLVALISTVAVAQTFPQSVYPVLEKAACRTCHEPDGVASTTRLQFPDEGANAAKLEEFGRSLVLFINRDQPEASPLLAKPTGRMGHAGGIRILPGSADEKVLRGWVLQLTKLAGPELAAALKYREREAAGIGYQRPQIALRRLTHSQYNNVVRDLVGDGSMPAAQFPPEDFINGFKTQYQGQSISPLLMEAYSAAAEKLARNAFRGGDTRGLLPCKEATLACRTKFVQTFGPRAFRRPLKADELRRYSALAARESDPVKSAQLIIEAMLQSPAFLFRLDETSDAALKPYATASRLSFALWDSMPPAALLEAAGKGELASEAQVGKWARQLLSDDRARRNLDEFTSQWLRFDRVLNTAKDRRQYPKFNREAAVAMTEETRRFVADLVWSGRDFMELFTDQAGYLTADLAAIYNVPAPAREYERVTFPADQQRSGILGQALFLAMTAKPDDTSPTSRGLFIREQFLCQHVAPPPPGVNTNLPPLGDGKPKSNKDRLAEHQSNPGCAGCHTLIDPIGFGFEKFDAIGGRREKARVLISAGHDEKPKFGEAELDTRGYVAGIPNSNFNSPRELGPILAAAPKCQECVVKQFFRYVSGRLETRADRPLIDRVTADFRASRFRFEELMISLAVHREFLSANPGEPAHVAHHYPAR